MSDAGTSAETPSPASPEPPRPRVLQNAIEVPFKGDTFSFRIPTILDEVKIGSRLREILRRADPESQGQVAGLDWMTFNRLEACAGFEILLEKASATWPFQEDSHTKRVTVSSAAFPPAQAETVLTVYQGFQEALRTFRAGGDTR